MERSCHDDSTHRHRFRRHIARLRPTREKEDREAVVRAITSGIQFAVASGRMDNEILEVLKEIGHDAHRISQNGAFVYTSDHRLLHERAFDPALARSIYERARTLEAIVLVCNEQTSFVETKTEQIEQMRARLFSILLKSERCFMRSGVTSTRQNYGHCGRTCRQPF